MTRAERKLRRRIESDAYAATARFWLGQRSADRIGHSKPVNRQASKDLSAKKGKSHVK